MGNDNNFSFAERIRHLNVEHYQVKQIYRMMESIMRRPGKTRHLHIIGSSNVGKTTVAEKFVEKYRGYTLVDEEGTEIDIKPVILIELPHPFTIMEFYQEIIKVLGGIRLKGPKTGEVKDQAIELIKAQKVKLIIIDEINNILTSRSVTDKEGMDAIKHLSNITRIPLVLMGTPESSKLRELDEQYKSRFRPKTLNRFTKCDEDFCLFLKEIEDQIEPPVPIGLGDMESGIPQVLYYQSKGKVGYLTPIIQEAYNILGVFEDGFNDPTEAVLDIEVLNEAYQIILGDIFDDKLE